MVSASAIGMPALPIALRRRHRGAAGHEHDSLCQRPAAAAAHSVTAAIRRRARTVAACGGHRLARNLSASHRTSDLPLGGSAAPAARQAVQRRLPPRPILLAADPSSWPPWSLVRPFPRPTRVFFRCWHRDVALLGRIDQPGSGEPDSKGRRFVPRQSPAARCRSHRSGSRTNRDSAAFRKLEIPAHDHSRQQWHLAAASPAPESDTHRPCFAGGTRAVNFHTGERPFNAPPPRPYIGYTPRVRIQVVPLLTSWLIPLCDSPIMIAGASRAKRAAIFGPSMESIR